MFLTIAAASLLTTPVPKNLAGSIRPEDTPIDELHQGKTTLVLARLTVSPAGRTRDCVVEISNGNEAVRKKTCALLQRRVRFDPARDSVGNPTVGIYRTVVSWWTGTSRPPSTQPVLGDIELTVEQLPPTIEAPAVVELMFAVDAAGTMSQCTAAPDEEETSLVPTACQQLLTQYDPIPAKDANGAPVYSVQNARVVFLTKPSGPGR